MTQEQCHKILEKLAYYHNELCKVNNFNTTREYNWKKAEEMFNLEIRTNGEEWLLSLLQENKDEDNTKI
jgi:hypothetical protein